MKVLCLFTALFCFSLTINDSAINLLCRQWKQVGYKNFKENYKSLNNGLNETIIVNKDGTYEKHLYGNLLFTGQWKINSDSTKIDFRLTTMNGVAMPDQSLTENKFTDSIIKLTPDTFICGSLAYYGEQKIYGHNDTYYIRIK